MGNGDGWSGRPGNQRVYSFAKPGQGSVVDFNNNQEGIMAKGNNAHKKEVKKPKKVKPKVVPPTFRQGS